jgi:hypothetical protein
MTATALFKTCRCFARRVDVAGCTGGCETSFGFYRRLTRAGRRRGPGCLCRSYRGCIHICSKILFALLRGENSFLDRSQRLVQISQKIFNVLNAHRNPYHAIGEPDRFSSFFSQGSMRHGGWM